MSKLFEQGFHVSIPFNGTTSYDLLAEKNGYVLKIQVKKIFSQQRKTGREYYEVEFRKPSAKEKGYTADEVDFFIAVSLEKDCCYVFPHENVTGNCTRTRVFFGEKEHWSKRFINRWELLEVASDDDLFEQFEKAVQERREIEAEKIH